jgi:23S rRNA pseudouridine1911/1915/1917 synthase
MDHLTVIVTEENCELPGRLDKILTALTEDLSRVRLQTLIKEGQVKVNGLVEKSLSARITAGDRIEIDIPAAIAAAPQPQNIPLDIVYEDDDMLVINKPAGLVVHPGAGNHDGTLVNALLHHCRGQLSGINGVLRPGIVHRLDKDTSGLMVAAKTDRAHKGLSEQLEDRSLSREYLALVLKVPIPLKGSIEGRIGRDPRNRQKMAFNAKNGRDARTFYLVEKNFGQACSLVRCVLESGRTHQIRVHMQARGHPLIGDSLYGAPQTAIRAALKNEGYDTQIIEDIIHFPRQALHAQSISFIHPVTDEEHFYECDLPEDLANLLKKFIK